MDSYMYPIQKLSLYMSHVFAVLAFALVFAWASGKNTDVKYLGGLDWSDKSGELFNYHPLFMVTGMVVLYTEGALAYRTFPLPKQFRKMIHGFFMFSSLIFVALGLYASIEYHNANTYANLYSLHSWMGLATVALYVYQYVTGFYAFLFPGVEQENRRQYLPVHIFIGIITYTMALLTANSGIQEKNSFLSCSVSVSSTDWDPIAHYYDLPLGCRISNGLGMVIVALLLTTTFTLWDFRPKRKMSSQRSLGTKEESRGLLGV